MKRDAITILSEISESDLNISNSSFEEAQYYENYNDPDFQNLLLNLKRLCKRERMLVTVYNKHIDEVQEEKILAEQALADFMHRSSVPLLESSNINDSNFTKNMFSTTNQLFLPSNQLVS